MGHPLSIAAAELVRQLVGHKRVVHSQAFRVMSAWLKIAGSARDAVPHDAMKLDTSKPVNCRGLLYIDAFAGG